MQGSTNLTGGCGRQHAAGGTAPYLLASAGQAGLLARHGGQQHAAGGTAPDLLASAGQATPISETAASAVAQHQHAAGGTEPDLPASAGQATPISETAVSTVTQHQHATRSAAPDDNDECPDLAEQPDSDDEEVLTLDQLRETIAEGRRSTVEPRASQRAERVFDAFEGEGGEPSAPLALATSRITPVDDHNSGQGIVGVPHNRGALDMRFKATDILPPAFKD